MADADHADDDRSEAGAKRFLLRLDPRLYQEVRALADQEMRSVNGQIVFLLSEALRARGRGKSGGRPPRG